MIARIGAECSWLALCGTPRSGVNPLVPDDDRLHLVEQHLRRHAPEVPERRLGRKVVQHRWAEADRQFDDSPPIELSGIVEHD